MVSKEFNVNVKMMNNGENGYLKYDSLTLNAHSMKNIDMGYVRRDLENVLVLRFVSFVWRCMKL